MVFFEKLFFCLLKKKNSHIKKEIVYKYAFLKRDTPGAHLYPLSPYYCGAGYFDFHL